MKNAIIRVLVGSAIVLLAQSAVLSSPAAAQAYGESMYGGGIYDNARSMVDGEGERSPGDTSSSGDEPNGAAAPGNLAEEDNDEQLAETESDPQSDEVEGNLDADDEQLNPEVEDSPEPKPGAPAYLKWVSLGALAASLLLIWAVIARKRRRERI